MKERREKDRKTERTTESMHEKVLDTVSHIIYNK